MFNLFGKPSHDQAPDASQNIEEYNSQNNVAAESHFSHGQDMDDDLSDDDIIGTQNPLKRKLSTEGPCHISKKGKEDNYLPSHQNSAANIETTNRDRRIFTATEILNENRYLAIHKVLQCASDPIVIEYVALVEKLKLLPTIPDIESMKEATKYVPEYNLTKDDCIFLIQNFMTIFQSKYFQQNVKKASANEKAIVNPKTRLLVPCSHLLPERSLTKFNELKKNYALLIQETAYDGSEVISELLILRNLNCIMERIYSFPRGDDNVNNIRDYFFATTYMKAQIEFVTKFNLKVINWEEKQCKISTHQPRWRDGENAIPPQSAFNNYAKNIIARINNDRENFEGAAVMNSYEDFINNGIKSSQRMQRNVQNDNLNAASSRQFSQAPGRFSPEDRRQYMRRGQKQYPSRQQEQRNHSHNYNHRGRGGGRRRNFQSSQQQQQQHHNHSESPVQTDHLVSLIK